jgi:hypothetical protein
MLNSLFRYEGQRTAEALTEYVNSEAGKTPTFVATHIWTILSVGIKSVGFFIIM